MRPKFILGINLFLMLIIFAPLFLKALHIDNLVYPHTSTKYFGAIQVLANDSIIYVVILTLFYISFFPKPYYIISILLRVLALLIFVLYSVDYLVIANFNTHLVFNDAIKYSSYSFKYISQISNKKIIAAIIAIIIMTGFMLLIVFLRGRIRSKIFHITYIFLIINLLLTSRLKQNDSYVHSWIYKDFISYNLTILSESKLYSADFVENFEFSDELHCSSKIAYKKNFIILMVESLSSYQSAFFSGIKDWTPQIDTIAANNIAFKDFYANGFTTEDGEVALLLGKIPIRAPATYSDGGGSSFTGFYYDVTRTLPNILKSKGYVSEFLTTADLMFANTDIFAKNIGFDYIEGHEHPYYDNWDRSHFKAAPDEALYHRALSRIEKNKGNNFFVFIKTVSTHVPYINPETKHSSEAETFLYADKQIGLFYKELLNIGFFNNGILIIVGDHRAMIPLKEKEIEQFGALKAAAIVPLIISYGDAIRSIEDKPYQQIDVFNGIKNLVSNTECSSDWVGDVLAYDKKSPKYIAHRRGDNRDIISVFSTKNSYLIKLDGDKTRITSDNNLDKIISDNLVNKINFSRIHKK